jgi:hypothetical protein
LQKVSLTGDFALAVLVSLALVVQPLAVRAESPNKPPVIQHDAVTFAVVGQSLTLKAKVTDVSPGVQDVTLYYALFRDATPFRVPMKPTGLDFYVGTIDASMIKDIKTLAYYIEATDKDGAMSETPWYNVEIRKADSTAVNQAGNPAGATDKKSGGTDWKTYGLIGAGVAGVTLGVIALANSGGGSSSGGGGGGSSTNTASTAGNYGGNVAIGFTSAGKTTYDNHSCAISITSQGSVTSATLLQGTLLSGSMSGNVFTLLDSAATELGGTNAVITFTGQVINNQIVGTVAGNSQTPPGSYSGNFNLTQ